MINKVEDFKDRLNKALSYRNLKAVELAEKTGLSEATISQYRSGYAKPKEDKLAIIANALEVNPAWLMGLDVAIHIEETMSFESPDHFEAWWLDHNGGRHPIELSRLEEQIIRKYRIADDKNKAMVRLTLGIDAVPTLSEDNRIKETKELPHLNKPTNSVGFAARRHTNTSSKLTKRRNENKS